jgi:cysteinyl-tRNA synthetase
MQFGWDFGPANQRGPKVFEEYSKPASSPTPNDADKILQKLVEQRYAVRANREFDKADQIRDALLDHKVYINDRLRQWDVEESFSKE